MANFENVKAGMTSEQVVAVDQTLTVSRTMVPVLGTPMMIGLMEKVSADLVDRLLPRNYTTVGYEVNVKHKAPARIGAQIKVWCKLLEVDGRKLLFEVRVTEGDMVIGEGFHRRTIISL
ncbi:MAG: thioesterase [Acidobacteria bacterium]|nr:thioesterase [Acidobacteriota bacterium]